MFADLISPRDKLGSTFCNNTAAIMADEDEDLSHLRGPEPTEIDLSDETQDFRFLDKLT